MRILSPQLRTGVENTRVISLRFGVNRGVLGTQAEKRPAPGKGPATVSKGPEKVESFQTHLLLSSRARNFLRRRSAGGSS
jgi:hypothetical protein